ncbi:nitrate ABC transporter permease [Rathayibacter rathayi]|uniref:Nitrate ABC transporter permease n=1 Tax=Rathayibacter rathayi TaxID=33887 RepID=A0ABD6W5M3_RATRA|nr:ABC transporter permease [Rathayibacter rathayi]PPF10781.1 nitrate ABC transporter permease [Rathayibacter rathayi]PPF77433.1 nitrate ABC transporter permease [Rathayibacter rathayi]PPG37275.1 nitrate ABC transporter permease [Rathayibacter rathayi]PPG87606.1 nitrate ABC transporter permease [Rathayibacter rathayi]PPG96648.1 nitrate ABC transporter permease [Rathayibacter rathayi]
MTIRDNETATDADVLRASTGLTLSPGATGLAVVSPSVAASQRRLRDNRAAGSRPLTSRRWFVVAGGAILPVLLLAAWQIATTSGLVSVAVFPSPAMVWAAGVDLAQRGDLGQDVAISTQRVLIGFALGSALGLVVGALFGLSRVWEVVLGPTLGAIRAVPSLAWVPLLLLWMGIGEESKITLITIGAFFPVFTTVATALGHVDRHLVEAGRAFGLSGVRLFTTVQLPAVIPSVISGLRLALAQSWLFLVASELIASSMGLGFRLIDSQNNGRIDRVFLAIVLLAVLGKLTDAVVGVFQRYAVRKWA